MVEFLTLYSWKLAKVEYTECAMYNLETEYYYICRGGKLISKSIFQSLLLGVEYS